jgi:hypothetical protein
VTRRRSSEGRRGRQAKAMGQDGVLGMVRDRGRLWAVEAGLRDEVKSSERLGGVWGSVRAGVPRLASEASGHDDFQDWGTGWRRRSGEGLGDSF